MDPAPTWGARWVHLTLGWTLWVARVGLVWPSRGRRRGFGPWFVVESPPGGRGDSRVSESSASPSLSGYMTIIFAKVCALIIVGSLHENIVLKHIRLSTMFSRKLPTRKLLA